MKKVLLLVMAVAAVSGCSSTAVNDRLAALEGQVASAQRAAEEAQNMARQAREAASGTSSDASAAKRLAQQALDAANETAERLRRMEGECCGGK